MVAEQALDQRGAGGGPAGVAGFWQISRCRESSASVVGRPYARAM
jgi:hypothetical protein